MCASDHMVTWTWKQTSGSLYICSQESQCSDHMACSLGNYVELRDQGLSLWAFWQTCARGLMSKVASSSNTGVLLTLAMDVTFFLEKKGHLRRKRFILLSFLICAFRNSGETWRLYHGVIWNRWNMKIHNMEYDTKIEYEYVICQNKHLRIFGIIGVVMNIENQGEAPGK